MLIGAGLELFGSLGMNAVLGAWFGTAVVLVVPGLLVARLTRLHLRSIATWALVPALSLGIVFVLAEVMTILGARFGLPAFGGLVAVLGLGWVVSARRDRLRAASEPAGAAGTDNTSSISALRVSHVLLVLGIVLGVWTWVHGMHGFGLVPPREDSANHGFFVARIIHTRSIAPSKVVVSDAQAASKVADYYPLGMHASAALVTQLTGARVGRVLGVLAVFFTAVVFPAGLYALARLLAPHRILIAGFTSLLAPMLTLYTFAAIQSGLLALIVSMAIVPISAVVVIRTLTRPGSVQLSAGFLGELVPAALALVALITVHTSEITTVSLITLVVVLGASRRSRRLLLDAIGRGALVALLAFVMLVPTVAQVGSGISERSQFDVFTFGKPLSTAHAIGKTLSLENAALSPSEERRLMQRSPPVQHNQARYALLAGIGAAIALFRRRSAYVVAWALIVVLTVLAYSSNGGLSRALTFPWYRQGDRLTMNQAFFVPFFAAVALEAALAGLRRRLHGRHALLGAATIVVVVAFVAVGAQGYQQANAALRFSYGGSDTPVTSAAESAFSWLHDHADRRETVINDFGDGSTWMYAEANVSPLFAVRAGDGNLDRVLAMQTPDLRERGYLVYRTDLVGSDARVDAAVRRFRARWIYYSEAVYFPGFPHPTRLSALVRNPYIHEVFRRERVHVFRIDLAPNAP